MGRRQRCRRRSKIDQFEGPILIFVVIIVFYVIWRNWGFYNGLTITMFTTIYRLYRDGRIDIYDIFTIISGYPLKTMIFSAIKSISLIYGIAIWNRGGRLFRSIKFVIMPVYKFCYRIYRKYFFKRKY